MLENPRSGFSTLRAVVDFEWLLKICSGFSTLEAVSVVKKEVG